MLGRSQFAAFAKSHVRTAFATPFFARSQPTARHDDDDDDDELHNLENRTEQNSESSVTHRDSRVASVEARLRSPAAAAPGLDSSAGLDSSDHSSESESDCQMSGAHLNSSFLTPPKTKAQLASLYETSRTFMK